MPNADAGDRAGRRGPRPTAVSGLLVLLAAASGWLDVLCLVRLGGFFASIITGNLVQLGRALAGWDVRPLAVGLTAVAGYAAGVAGGALALRGTPPGWQLRTTVAMAAEMVLLAGFAAGWLAAEPRPGHPVGLALLAGAAAASGTQSMVSIGSGQHNPSTTYLTGSLTAIVRTLVLDPHRVAATAGGLSRLLGLFAGAALGAVGLRLAPDWAGIPPAVLVAVAVLIATAHHRQRRKRRW
ncbi:DUF1275 family protein [Plantactinospora siamensis]|uniref:DUF1275 family protein n=1 Tax=Plantactinospora siamensis TaxID=555372 RepID=A0ABV6NUX2_9ACTN